MQLLYTEADECSSLTEHQLDDRLVAGCQAGVLANKVAGLQRRLDCAKPYQLYYRQTSQLVNKATQSQKGELKPGEQTAVAGLAKQHDLETASPQKPKRPKGSRELTVATDPLLLLEYAYAEVEKLSVDTFGEKM